MFSCTTVLFHETGRILKLTWNFGGGQSDTASTFLKRVSTDGYFLYEDDFDAVITINDC